MKTLLKRIKRPSEQKQKLDSYFPVRLNKHIFNLAGIEKIDLQAQNVMSLNGGNNDQKNI